MAAAMTAAALEAAERWGHSASSGTPLPLPTTLHSSYFEVSTRRSMKAAAIGVDAVSKTHVGTVILGEDVPRRVLDHLEAGDGGPPRD